MAKRVVALEPEPDMVVVGQRSTKQHANIEWVLGRDLDISRLFGSTHAFDLVTIGNAFHLMERTRLLDDLDAVVAASGCVVVCSSGVPAWLQSADWSAELLEVLRGEFGMSADRSGVPDHDADLGVLSRSMFSVVETWTFERQEKRSVSSIVGELVSSASVLIDSERAKRLYEVLSPYAIDGSVPEQVTTTALIATRRTAEGADGVVLARFAQWSLGTTLRFRSRRCGAPATIQTRNRLRST